MRQVSALPGFVALVTLIATVTPKAARADTEAAPRSPEERTVHAVFFEAFGNGLLYTVNYEHIFPSIHLGIRGGASYFATDISDKAGSGKLKLATFPIVGSYYLGSGRHFLQLGGGLTVLYLGASTDSTGTQFSGEAAGVGVAATAVVGYRYLPETTGFDFGVGFTPLVRTSGFLPWGGIHAGAVF